MMNACAVSPATFDGSFFLPHVLHSHLMCIHKGLLLQGCMQLMWKNYIFFKKRTFQFKFLYRKFFFSFFFTLERTFEICRCSYNIEVLLRALSSHIHILRQFDIFSLLSIFNRCFTGERF